MSDQNIVEELEKEYLSIREELSAGRSSHDQKELDDLIFRFIHEMEGVYNRDVFSKSFRIIEIWEEIFNTALVSNFAHPILERMQSGSFYDFGRYLLKVLPELNSVNQNSVISLIYSYLDFIRLPVFLVKLYQNPDWEKLIYTLIVESNFTIPHLFKQRLDYYRNKVLFKQISGKVVKEYLWSEAAARMEEYTDAICTELRGKIIGKPQVAFLTENSLEMALLDLACLSSGIVDVMIPANSVAQHIELILNQTEVQLLFVSNEKQLSKIKSLKNNLTELKKVILLTGSSAKDWAISISEFLEARKNQFDAEIAQRRAGIRVDDLATVMYTSGTTGEPKGIMFTHVNIVFKRFCRALAIPPIGDGDRFLCYLPLFHTFGRWFEMMGAIFWGAEYIFMENPSLEAMISNMNLVKPTIFISIPKKWTQLFEEISRRVDIELARKSEISEAIKSVTGGELRWGLSAAGYLSPEVFKFFQKYGIELMSGFGMTEATGGITMTPVEEYEFDSLGRALPGIEIKIAKDGELLIRGPYVMKGYYGIDDKETFDSEGYFPTGDVMEMDDKEFIKIIDRKKEIYKNIKGETIAPQKIENLFRDFDSVEQVFLAGDHKPFNTALIFPNKETDLISFNDLSEEKLKDYFSSVVVTVNSFLAPFERIVDFRLIDRAISEDFDELTEKGTFKRRKIEKNFEFEITQMYKQSHISIWIDGTEVRIPNWFLREKGSLQSDIKYCDGQIKIEKLDCTLTVEKLKEESEFRIGSFVYRIDAKFIDFQPFLTNPMYWLGNFELVNFSSDSIIQWQRNIKHKEIIHFVRVAERPSKDELNTELFLQIHESGERSIEGLHLAAILMQNSNFVHADDVLSYFSQLMSDETLPVYKFAERLIFRPKLLPDQSQLKQLLLIAFNHSPLSKIGDLLKIYLELKPDLIDEEIITEFIKIRNPELLDVLADALNYFISISFIPEKSLPDSVLGLIHLIESHSIKHPSGYKKVRFIFIKLQLEFEWEELSNALKKSIETIRTGFRNWLGENQSIAVDPETNREYGWKDVIIVEEGIDPADAERMVHTIENTSILREAVFLLSKAVILRLNSIPPGGIWISKLSYRDVRSVYRVSIQTRYFGSFDLVVYLNKSAPIEKIREEISWLIAASGLPSEEKLVSDFAGYWEPEGIWCEEYVSGDSVKRTIQRGLRKRTAKDEGSIKIGWPFFVWNAAAAYASFWKLTGNKIQIGIPSAEQIVIPAHDYQIGRRLLSIGNRIASGSIVEFINNFYKHFIRPIEEEFHELVNDDTPRFIFSGIVEALGEESAEKLLRRLLENRDERESHIPDSLWAELENFLTELKEEGFLTRQLYFAVNRFHRWNQLNSGATPEAQAETIRELYSAYSLQELSVQIPEIRIRFFTQTAFINSSPEMISSLKGITHSLRSGEINKAAAFELITDLQNELDLTESDKYFLPRLVYPYLRAVDEAAFIEAPFEGKGRSNLVVEQTDYDGEPFLIRDPISPKEISKLHQLFNIANLLVNFLPEHKFLVAISERGYLIGGLFYSHIRDKTVYMDKIVVSDKYRRKGISEGLMHEFFNRLRSLGIEAVTTGFFRPEYFYKFGFKIEKKYSGLVKDLSIEEAESETP